MREREWGRSQAEDGRDKLCVCVCVSCSCCCHSCCNVNQLHYHKLLLAYVSVLPQSRCTSWRRQAGGGSQRSCGRQTQRNALDSVWVANRIKWCNYGQVLARSRSRPAANIIKKPLAQIDNGASQPWDGQSTDDAIEDGWERRGEREESLLLWSVWARRLSLSDLLACFFFAASLFVVVVEVFSLFFGFLLCSAIKCDRRLASP